MYDFQKNSLVDLHVHSNLSDGVYSPEELIELAIKRGIKALAITDHNCINDNLRELWKKYTDIISLPPASEISCGYKTSAGRIIQIHIGAIGFSLEDKEIRRIIAYNNEAMKPYVENILRRLKTNCNIDLCTYDELVSRSPSVSIGRKHVALEMVRQKIVEDVEQAFDEYLGEGKKAYVSNATKYASIDEIVPAIVKSNGIAVLNHLFKYNLSFKEMDSLLKGFKKLAGDHAALEVYYSAYDEKQQFFLKKLADSYGFLCSCGSDYHGDSKIKDLGKFPYEVYENMMRTVLDLPIT